VNETLTVKYLPESSTAAQTSDDKRRNAVEKHHYIAEVLYTPHVRQKKTQTDQPPNHLTNTQDENHKRQPQKYTRTDLPPDRNQSEDIPDGTTYLVQQRGGTRAQRARRRRANDDDGNVYDDFIDGISRGGYGGSSTATAAGGQRETEQRLRQHSGGGADDLPKVVRGSILIKNSIDTTGGPRHVDIVAGSDSDGTGFVVEDNTNLFHGQYFQSRENPMFHSDPEHSDGDDHRERKRGESSARKTRTKLSELFDDENYSDSRKMGGMNSHDEFNRDVVINRSECGNVII